MTRTVSYLQPQESAISALERLPLLRCSSYDSVVLLSFHLKVVLSLPNSCSHGYVFIFRCSRERPPHFRRELIPASRVKTAQQQLWDCWTERFHFKIKAYQRSPVQLGKLELIYKSTDINEHKKVKLKYLLLLKYFTAFFSNIKLFRYWTLIQFYKNACLLRPICIYVTLVDLY